MAQAGSSAMDVRDRLRGLCEHESICGSKVAPCDSCGRSVMLNDVDIHHIRKADSADVHGPLSRPHLGRDWRIGTCP